MADRKIFATLLNLLILSITLLSIISCNNPQISEELPNVSKEKITEVRLTSSDNMKIDARLYKADNEERPIVILLHMLGSDQTSYNLFVPKLLENGINVMTLDFRGHGKSGGSLESFVDKDYQAMINDVNAATDYIAGIESIDDEKIVIIGASIGANIALNYAVNDERVKFVVLLSPGLDYKGVKTDQAILDYGDRPIEIIAGQEDKYSYDSSRALTDNSPSTKLSFRNFGNDLHGTNLLNDKLIKDLIEDIKPEII